MSEISFGTDGWRAIIAREFTFRNFGIVVQAIANLLAEERLPGQPAGARKVLIGYDARAMAREFAEEAVAICEGNGLTTSLPLRPIPTPALAHAIVNQEAVCGLMLTASHNPPAYMGIKFIPWYAGPALTDITKMIEAEVAKVEAAPAIRRAEKPSPDVLDPRRAYFATMRRLIDFDAIREAGLRICCDPMHGVTAGYIDTLLRAAGCDAQIIRADPNPTFGGGEPDPRADRLGPLIERVVGGALDLGLANDGDGDRFGIVDATGGFISTCDYLALLAEYHLTARRPDGDVRMVRTVATSHLIDAVCERHGATVTETPVGFKFIGEELRAGAYLGGEESGGMSRSDHIPEKDGIFACLLAAEIVAKCGGPASRLVRDLKAQHGDYLWFRENLHLTRESQQRVMEQLRALTASDVLAGRQVARIDTRDGVKVHLEDGSWLLGRPSGTEPIVRVYAEGRSPEAREALGRAADELVRKATGE